MPMHSRHIVAAPLHSAPVPSTSPLFCDYESRLASPLYLNMEDAGGTVDSCHSLTLPLVLSSQAEPFLLKLCIHPSWNPQEGAVHLVSDSVYLAPEGIHSPPRVRVEYPVVDLYENCLETLQVEPSPSPSPQRETSPIQESTSSSSNIWLNFRNQRNILRTTLSPVRISALIALLVAYLILALTGHMGHPAWVFVRSTNETTNALLWQPGHVLYRSYQDTILPLVTPFELPSPITPARPSSLLGALEIELNEVVQGLVSWRGSPIPGPDPALTQQGTQLCQELRFIQRDYIALYEHSFKLLPASLADVLAHAIDTNNTVDAIKRIARFWAAAEADNDALIKVLWDIERRLVNLDVVSFLDAAEHHLDQDRGRDSYNNWIANIFDAIDFARANVLPLTSHIEPFVSKAITSLLTLDSSIALQVEFWENSMLRRNGIIEVKTTYEALSDTPRWWNSWVLRVHNYVGYLERFDETTMEETKKIAIRGKIVKVAMSSALKENGTRYLDRRPERPRNRRKKASWF